MNMNRVYWGRTSVFASVLALLLVTTSVAFAQTQETTTPPASEVEQLKTRLQHVLMYGPCGPVGRKEGLC